jgi:MFS family permease
VLFRSGLLASGGALAIASAFIGTGAGLNRYLVLIAAGSLLGLIGVGLMARVPGGAPVAREAAGAGHGTNMLAALRDRNFTRYLGAIAGQTLGTTLLISFLPLYLSARAGLPAARIMRLDLVAMVGGALASLGMGWLSDRVGSRPVLMPAAALLAGVPLGWLLLADTPASSGYPVLFLLFGVASNGVIIGANRLLYNGVAPPDKNTAYLAIYYAWIGLAGGLAPLIGGAVLHLSATGGGPTTPAAVDGYTVLFSLALLALVASWLLFGRVRRDGGYSTRTAVRGFLNRLAWR